MLNAFRRSLRAKVVAVVLVTTLAALSVSTLALLYYEFSYYESFLREDAATQADILARASAPALAFDDPSSAVANLSLLNSRPNYLAAAIYNEAGEMFASYSRAGENPKLPAAPDSESTRVGGGRIEVFLPVVQDGTPLGTVYLSASYDLEGRLVDYVLILAIVTLLGLAAAGAVSLPLAAGILRPVRAVTGTAREVVETRDFALRAQRTSSDEAGVLVDAFNAMLAEVGARAEALETSNRLLQKETEERRMAENALRLADRRKDEFLATLAHELRNPLAPMVSATELMSTPGVDGATSDRAREIIGRQLRQLVRLVDDLLDVSRITSGKLTVRKEIIELESAVQNAVDTVRPMIDKAGIELAVSLPSGPVRLHADPVRLAQVLSNLLNNAIKFSPTGSRITLTAEVENGSVRISIADSGTGISAESLSSIFDMFTQGDHRHAGLGVGLALAKRFVELHDGTISAHSAGTDRGSTFTIVLPVTDAAPAAAATAVAAEVGGEGPRHRILVCDDNVDFALSLVTLLGALGHDVRFAHDGTTALEIAREFQPDFAFLDLGLPDITGHEVARRLRGHPETAEAVLVAVSGWGQPEDRRRSAEAGFALHLVKPLSLEELKAAITNVGRQP